MILVVERFNNTDNRSVEDLFYQVQRDVINQMVNVAVVTLLDILIDSVRDFFHATEEQIEALMRRAFSYSYSSLQAQVLKAAQ